MPTISPEMIQSIVGNSPAAVLVCLLLALIRYLFKRWDDDREARIEDGQRYADLARSAITALEASNRATTELVLSQERLKIRLDEWKAK